MSNYCNDEFLTEYEATASQVAKMRTGVDLVLDGDIDTDLKARIELSNILKTRNPDLEEKAIISGFSEMNKATGKTYLVEAIYELGNPANKEKYAKIIEKYGNEIDLLFNTCFGNAQPQAIPMTGYVPPIMPQMNAGINIQPYVIAGPQVVGMSQQPQQQPCISGSPELDMAINLLAAPNMVAQMDAIASNFFAACSKQPLSETDKAELATAQNTVNIMLGMLKDPAQLTALKQAAGFMMTNEQKANGMNNPINNLFSMVLGGGCACGHERATVDA